MLVLAKATGQDRLRRRRSRYDKVLSAATTIVGGPAVVGLRSAAQLERLAVGEQFTAA
jgi:hypothetical protein